MPRFELPMRHPKTPWRALALLVALLLTASSRDAGAQESLVRLNGLSTPVYYNDGDTFRALAGPMRRRPFRLGGFNTLESYGPTHRWGGWHYKELYVLAKLGTYNARRGFWTCEADPNRKDGYGRLLANCPDLRVSQLKTGFAHIMVIDEEPPLADILAQREAIVHRRGIWAKGVPSLVLTSLHSADERFDSTNNYNRLVSPLDGYAGDEIKWRHQENYSECQEVCHPDKRVGWDDALRVIAALRADATTGPVIAGYEDVYLMVMLNEFVTVGRVAKVFGEKGHEILKSRLDALLADGTFGQIQDAEGACMNYTTFERRYRFKPKPECLKW